MKKILTLLMLIPLLLITSCELFTDEPTQGDIYYINVALDYDNNDDINTLTGTIPDARELHQALPALISRTTRTGHGYLMLQEGLGFSGDGSYTINGTTIPNYPSLANIETLLTEHAQQATENDLTIFTYSGHGEDQSGDLVLATTHPSSPNRMDSVQLLGLMSAIKGKKLVILDSCFSGKFVPGSPSSTSTVLDNSIITFFETYHSSKSYTKPDLFVLTASAHTDSYEANFGPVGTPHYHGVFTYALLEALGWIHTSKSDPSHITISYPPAAKGGRITVDGLLGYIKKNQAIPTRLKLFGNWFSHQHPLTTGGPLDLVLFNL